MSFIPSVPGFGTFNLTLPDAVGEWAGQAADMVRELATQAPPADVAPEAVLPPPEAPVQEKNQEKNTDAPRSDIALRLSSSHSVVLAHQLTAPAAPVPDVSRDAEIAAGLLQPEAAVASSASSAPVIEVAVSDTRSQKEISKAEKKQAKIEWKQAKSEAKQAKKSHHHHHHHHHSHHKSKS